MDVPKLVPVEYRGELVALVSRERAHIISPWLLERPAGDPELRFVAFMCLCCVEVLSGRLAGPFTNELAEAWARVALIGPDQLAELEGSSDEDVADALNVPAEQVRIARHAPVV